MRESPTVPVSEPPNARAHGSTDGDISTIPKSDLLLAAVLAVGLVFWQHWVLFAMPGSLRAHAPYVVLDLMLAIPVAGLAVRLIRVAGRRLGLQATAGRSPSAWEPAVRAAATAIAMTVLYVPMAILQAVGHSVLGSSTGQHQHHGAGGLPATDAAGLLGYGLAQAAQAQVAILVLALAGVTLVALSARSVWRVQVAPALRRVSTVGWVLALAAGSLAGTLGPAPGTGALADVTAGGGSFGGCSSAPQRVFNVSAINVDIVVNRFGDHDPFGYMYVLNDKEDEVRAQEAALQAASALEIDDPTAAKVSHGLGQDAIQPLVVRARLGECVVFNLTNKLTAAPRGGPTGNPSIVQPGGVPSVSIDLAGVSYDASGGQGGQAVGWNPTSVMAAPGATKQYKYFLDPSMGEGAKVFRSGGDSTQLTAHGLFGTLIAEDSGARWYDPASGAEKTGDNNWSNWEAMVDPSVGPTFREFTIIYHEIGDENFNLRRPLRENDEGPVAGDQATFGRPLPMIDAGAPNPTVPTAGGGGTDAYRPSSRALNYRSESFFRRLQLEAARGLATQEANESIAYSSYPYGDPSTPIPRSYLGEPTKTRLVHAGFEQVHVHHLHGGGTRWRQNPGADNTAIDAGLSKVPIQNAKSIRLDSQTISPMESFSLEHECGAGGCQQAAGDFLYHCHIAHHYLAGMFGIWRVFDTAQPGLAKLPGRSPAPDAVNSAGLLGRVIEGKTVVLAANLTNPGTQVALESLVESQLPPPGTRWDDGTGADPDDATVWDWLKGGTPTAPVYLGEPETTSIWANYSSETPGARPEILFNPTNGRPAFPMLRPHLGMRPPFSPNGHSGAPRLGDTTSPTRPDGLCPSTAPVREYDITAISVAINATNREVDNNGLIFVLNEDKDAVLGGTKTAEPLAIRSNVGDCVAITFGQEMNPAVMQKTNMHTHFVQFDPLASDGVITGFSFEQSVFSANREGRTLVSVDAPNQVTVSNVDKLRTGISIGVGVGRTSIEVKKITAINGNQLTFDSNLANTHVAGEPVTVEFVQYRWYSDVDSGTVFWHDHVDGIDSWGHGLFGAHIIEPKGSTYRDPVTGAEVRSGTIVDIVNTSGGSVGVGQSGSFREFMIFLHNGRRGRSEITAPGSGLLPFNPGQECEEGSINLRAEPIGERTPPGATPADPATTMQRQEYNGVRCRNSFTRVDNPTNANAVTQRATITTVDPYVFSSVKYGDPNTPLLRAYAGDPVVIRTIGLAERAEALRIQGHRFRMERFNADAQLMDTATTGISERFDYILDGGAGGPMNSPGDYLYYSTRTFALESGAWGIFRVHDKLQSNLKVLPGRTAPPTGQGFPKQAAATGDTQQNPGPDPAPAYKSDGSINTSVVTSTANPCPWYARTLNYDVSIFNKALPTSPFSDVSGVIYSLTTDMSGILAGTKRVEPLVIRANKGDCVKIKLRNQTTAGSLYGGTRAGLDLGKLLRNQQLSAGAAVGLNPDTTVPAGGSQTYTFYADRELGTTLFQNLGSTASLRHGATGMLVVEPENAVWTDSFTDAPLGPNKTAVQAIIRVDNGPKYREFALMVQTTDQQFARSIIPYIDLVAGIGINSVTGANVPAAPVPGAPPGTAGNAGSFDKAYNHVNYHSEPLTERLGLTANVADFTQATVIGSYGEAFSSRTYGEPDTPVLQTYAKDPVRFRVGVGASDQLHSFTISGHMFPLEPGMWNGTTDRRSQLMTARTIGAGETLDAEIDSAGGSPGYDGDYLYQDARQSFTDAGIWGIFRVHPNFFGFESAVDGSLDVPAAL